MHDRQLAADVANTWFKHTQVFFEIKHEPSVDTYKAFVVKNDIFDLSVNDFKRDKAAKRNAFGAQCCLVKLKSKAADDKAGYVKNGLGIKIDLRKHDLTHRVQSAARIAHRPFQAAVQGIIF